MTTDNKEETKLRQFAEKYRDNLKDHVGREDDITAFIYFAKSSEVRSYHLSEAKGVDVEALEHKIESILLTDAANLQDEEYTSQVDGAVESIMDLITPYLQKPSESEADEFSEWPTSEQLESIIKPGKWDGTIQNRDIQRERWMLKLQGAELLIDYLKAIKNNH